MSRLTKHAFGLSLAPELELPGLRSCEPSRASVSMRLVEPRELRGRSGDPGDVLWTTVMDDAQPIRLERMADGGHRFEYGRRADFLLSPRGDSILCAPAEPDDPSWKRFLLDTVLFTTSLLHGFEALHASSVAVDGRILAFLAFTGGGKTSLAYELVRRGGTLFCDDVLALESGASGVVAHPGPALMNVPLAISENRRVRDSGRALAVLGDEVWLEVADAPVAPDKLAGLFLLDRHTDHGEPVLKPEGSSMPLVAHALGIKGSDARLRKRFDLLADLARDVPIYRLEVGPSAPPEALADLVEETLAPSPRVAARVGA